MTEDRRYRWYQTQRHIESAGHHRPATAGAPDRQRIDPTFERVANDGRGRQARPAAKWPMPPTIGPVRVRQRSARRFSNAIGLMLVGGLGMVLLVGALLVGLAVAGIGSTAGDRPTVTVSGGGRSTKVPATATESVIVIGPSGATEHLVAVTSDQLDAYWRAQFATSGRAAAYVSPRDVTTFTHASAYLASACGNEATTQISGFYCPADHRIYIATDQYTTADEILTVAHEWGHHIRTLLDPDHDAEYAQNPVPMELQAECAAGLWASVAARTGTLSRDEIAGYEAALLSDGDVTHGTGEQIQAAFARGYQGGTPAACGYALAAG